MCSRYRLATSWITRPYTYLDLSNESRYQVRKQSNLETFPKENNFVTIEPIKDYQISNEIKNSPSIFIETVEMPRLNIFSELSSQGDFSPNSSQEEFSQNIDSFKE